MNLRQSVTIIVDKTTVDKLESFYQNQQVDNDGEYIIFFAKKNGTNIAIYSSKKQNEYKVIFTGNDALLEAKIWDKDAAINKKKERSAPTKASWTAFDDQIGSDEVGTGDFFGPITVAAAYVKKSDLPYLKELGVDDSKRLSDEQILKLGKILIKKFPYSQVALNNEKYNELIDNGLNINEMKCKMHNQVLLNLHKKYSDVKNVFVDQFLEADKYYKYLDGEKEIVNNITFKTKGETYFPCVALASIIARYSFLMKMAAMSKKYGRDIPFGASKKVTKFAQDFLKCFGRDELLKNVKKNFANLSEVIK